MYEQMIQQLETREEVHSVVRERMEAEMERQDQHIQWLEGEVAQ